MSDQKSVDELHRDHKDTHGINCNGQCFKAGHASRDAEVNRLTYELDKSRSDHQAKIITLEQALEVAEKYFNIIAKDQTESDIAIYGRDENGDLAEIALEKIQCIKEGK